MCSYHEKQVQNSYIMQDSLGGNCLTHLLACVYPHPANTRECLSTLQFALRCANVKTSPVVNTVTVPSKTSNDSNSNALIAELTKEVADLQRELDDTHAHYHKLLEGSKPGQFDYGPIERAADASALAEAEAAAEEEAAVQGRAPENSSDSVQDSKRPGSSTGAAKADEAGGLTRSSTLANRAEIGKPRTAVSGRASGASQEQMQQVRYRYLAHLRFYIFSVRVVLVRLVLDDSDSHRWLYLSDCSLEHIEPT